MKVSLNDLVSLLSDRVGQPFNVPLQEELKVIFNYKRADWLQKILDKYPGQRRYFYKDIVAELERVDAAECPIEVDCLVLRTVEKIPLPLRSGYALFDYVGDPDKTDGYAYTETQQVPVIVKHGSRWTPNRPKYFYTNGYIYILNEKELDYINIRGIWPDQRQLSPFKCDDVPCYTDDDQWEIPDDIINTMVQDVLKNELRLLTAPEAGEVKVDEQAKTQALSGSPGPS